MNILVIGKGGREEALVRALRLSKKVKKIYTFPKKNVAGAQALDVQDIHLQNISEKMAPILKKQEMDLVVIGPEQELVEGWSDVLRSHGFLVFGPSQRAARLEGSKIFAKKFMEEGNIPTSAYQKVQSVSDTLKKACQFQSPYVLKADGLAGGKGVFICQNLKELEQKAQKLFKTKSFAHSEALLEEFQKGYEISVFIFTNGQDYQMLPLVKDYKKRNENNQGPNTGGMGAVAPVNIDCDLLDQIHQKILKPTCEQMKNKNMLYKGVLYIGLMVTSQGPYVLEYNVRFGDPECQALLPLIDGDLAQIFYDVAQGKLTDLKFQKAHSCCLVLSEKGYPDHPQKGGILQLPTKLPENSYILYAGAKKQGESWIIDGGRVLNIVAVENSDQKAQEKVYQVAQSIPNDHLYYRKDIGK